MLIGITGKARAGKDTMATFFIKNSGYAIERYSFAKPLKDACAVMFGWDDRHLYGELKEVHDPFWGFSPRKAMQTLGTEWGRNLNPEIWIRCAEKFVSEHEHVVVADVRFDNEANFIRSRNGIIINVVRPGLDAVGIQGHASEAGLSDQTGILTFVNNGSLDHMDDFTLEILKLNSNTKT